MLARQFVDKTQLRCEKNGTELLFPSVHSKVHFSFDLNSLFLFWCVPKGFKTKFSFKIRVKTNYSKKKFSNIGQQAQYCCFVCLRAAHLVKKKKFQRDEDLNFLCSTTRFKIALNSWKKNLGKMTTFFLIPLWAFANCIVEQVKVIYHMSKHTVAIWDRHEMPSTPANLNKHLEERAIRLYKLSLALGSKWHSTFCFFLPQCVLHDS